MPKKYIGRVEDPVSNDESKVAQVCIKDSASKGSRTSIFHFLIVQAIAIRHLAKSLLQTISRTKHLAF